MKKTIILAVVALMSSTAICAQERLSTEEREKGMAERIERAGDRVATELGLKDDAKKDFLSIYSEYQKEMFATNQNQGPRPEQIKRGDEKKELSKEDAEAQIKENFERQEQQIKTMQKRLEVQKKYVEEFGKVLTPQQVLKVLTPQRGGQGGREQMRRQGEGNGERRGGFEGGPRRGGFEGGPRGGGFGGPGGGGF